MSATAALASATTSSSNMDIDENDLPSSPSSPSPAAGEEELLLSERLSKARIGEIQGDTTTIQMNTSEEESTLDLDEDDLPNTQGFFIDSKSHHQSLQSSQASWPSTPPQTSARSSHRAVSSCPRPTTTTATAGSTGIGMRKRQNNNRPLFVSSSSGALLPPPTIERSSSSYEELDTDNTSIDMCPATRAAAAIQALEQNSATVNTNTNHNHLGDHHHRHHHHDGMLSEMQVKSIDERYEDNENNYNNNGNNGGGGGGGSHAPGDEYLVDISRQDTFHTSHPPSSLNDLGETSNTGNRSSSSSGGGAYSLSLSGPNEQTFPAYPTSASRSNNKNKYENDVIPSLYTFSSGCRSGKILTYLSARFVPPHKQHTHGGSALAGFLALLFVTCANYMLGPMRDAAALAVGVSHIPALTLASTVLALGSSVPVGWLFEAPDPRRRRVWKRMGLTRGETQGTSLALFYRVFAFLLCSYALGFKMVDKYGGRGKNNHGGDDNDDNDGGYYVAEEESAITLIGSFFLRLMVGVGIPITNILSSTSSIQSTIELYANESIPSLFLHAFKCVVNKFGKVIYIMFFLVVHLMKLHSLSLIWGVTTEAMEYEENAELRRAAKEKESMATRVGSAGGLVVLGRSPNGGTNGNDSGGTQTTSSKPPPSKSAMRLKRLAFVGFGGTLGGILGSVIASFAAHILHLSGLLIVAAILLEISANLSVELGRIMQRHWEEQMKYQSCGDLTSLLSAENLTGQGSQNRVDTSMRKSVSMGSMKRVASGSLSSGNLANLAAMQQQQQQQQQQGGGRRESMPVDGDDSTSMTRVRSQGSISLSSEDRAKLGDSNAANKQAMDQPMIDDNSFKQRLLRGITTILRSRLLMSIFTYNALYASTSVLLSFQRAELVANRETTSSGSGSSNTSTISNTAFLAKINTLSSVSVFVLQASGLGAYIANGCGQRGALALMPIIRLCGVILLGWWHFMSNGKPPDLISFLVIDEFTKVINFAIAKPVRENLWRGLSAEARYEAKPIVDTLANRWGGGSAAFLVSFINRIVDVTDRLGVVNEKNGERTIFGFPPVLLLCMIITAWWTAVSADVGNIRRKIDLELKKQQ